jgi:hypothetical protein
MLQERLDALGAAARAELLHVLMLPDFERADRIGEFWDYPESRAFADLLIDCRRIGRSGRCWSACCGSPTATSEGLAESRPLGGRPAGRGRPRIAVERAAGVHSSLGRRLVTTAARRGGIR